LFEVEPVGVKALTRVTPYREAAGKMLAVVPACPSCSKWPSCGKLERFLSDLQLGGGVCLQLWVE
jgi:hypothetical protein